MSGFGNYFSSCTVMKKIYQEVDELELRIRRIEMRVTNIETRTRKLEKK